MKMKYANGVTVRAYGENFLVKASSVEERRMVEERAKQLWLEFREPSLWEWENLNEVTAEEWLNQPR